MANFKNIVGSGFPTYVTDQLNKRGEKINEKNRNNNTLQFLTNRNAWFRLSSSVNTDSDNDGKGDDKLARGNILQGGTLKNNQKIKGGFNETYSRGTDDDLGFKPMPGITNVSIGTGGKWQTLMQADIEFICYDLGQLDIMTKLYMSLGCSVFLEWGHSNYFRKDNTFEPNPSDINFFNFKDRNLLLKEANKKRKNAKGNYECLLGKVYNFEWSANNDGSYNCKIQVMGAGGIVESLKINTASNVNFDIFLTEEDTDANFASDLECILTTYKKFFRKSATEIDFREVQNASEKEQDKTFSKLVPITLDKRTTNSDNDIISYGDYLNSVFLSPTYEGPQFINNTIFSNENVRKGNAHQVISGLASDPDNKKEFTIPRNLTTDDYTGYITGQIINNHKFFQTYITLAHLFTLIQHIGIFSEGGEGTPFLPEVYLDYNPDNTPIKQSSSLQGSVDPSKCLIPPRNIGNYFVDVIENFEVDEISAKNANLIPPFDGKLFNVLVNLDFAIDSLKSISTNSEDKTANLMDFMVKILDGINVSLGKINSFRPFYDSNSNCIRIVDENVLPDSKENKVIEIPNFGTKSLVYDYNFNSKISPKLASQIVIAAQASGKDLKDFPEDILSYASINGNAVDRLAKTKVPAIFPKFKFIEDYKKQLLPFKKLYQLLERVYNFNDLSIENINNLTSFFDDVQNRNLKVPKRITQTQRVNLITGTNTFPFASPTEVIPPPTLIIPIEYNIKIDGISGILPYNIFRIPDNRLPKRYRGKVDFAIFSINHEIENNKWYTILRGQIVIRN